MSLSKIKCKWCARILAKLDLCRTCRSPSSAIAHTARAKMAPKKVQPKLVAQLLPVLQKPLHLFVFKQTASHLPHEGNV